MIKIELGGGRFPKGEGFLNVDCEGWPAVDKVHDLNQFPWPFEDDSVDEVYTAHCIEHVNDPHPFLFEIARICHIDAKVVIRAPDPMGEMCFVTGHNHAVGEVWFRNLLTHFPKDFWHGPKILQLDFVERRADATWFPRARQSRLFKKWTNDEIMSFVPRTCHENEFRLTVIANEHYTA